VVRDHQLLQTARDYFQFVTNFFEVINVSATHLYHSALELSPLSSIVRKLYYHQKPHPSPRVIIGTPDSWEPTSAVPTNHSYYLSSTWSPCCQFVAVVAKEAVQIWDALTLKLLSIPHPTKATTRFRHGLAYSPDGYSLAACSDTGIIIWDTKTGGEVSNIEAEITGEWLELVWSLDGKAIGTISPGGWSTFIVHVYNTVTGAILSPGTLHSMGKPHIWACNNSFQVVVTPGDQKNQEIVIFEVGQTLKKTKSFPFQSHPRFEAFSPKTHWASVSTSGDHHHDPELIVLDVHNSEVLLKTTGSYRYHSFSPDANFFAAFTGDHLLIWSYTSGHYIQWREFQQTPVPLQFSPTSSSILGYHGSLIHILHLDYSPTVVTVESTITAHNQPMDAFAPDGTYIATAYHGESTITITSLKSQTPFPAQFIDTELEISSMVLTGNVLLVNSSDKIVAWLLTEEGMVDGIVGNTRADHNDSLWEISSQALTARWSKIFGQRNRGDDRKLEFSVADEIAAIKYGGFIIRAYHTSTGEVIKSTEVPQSHGRTWYQFLDPQQDGCNLYHCDQFKHQGPLDCEWSVSQAALQEGWVKDPEGKHRLWLHPSWRSTDMNVNWLHNATTLRLKNPSELAIIKF
jgi:WD40 repeat protein